MTNPSGEEQMKRVMAHFMPHKGYRHKYKKLFQLDMVQQ